MGGKTGETGKTGEYNLHPSVPYVIVSLTINRVSGACEEGSIAATPKGRRRVFHARVPWSVAQAHADHGDTLDAGRRDPAAPALHCERHLPPDGAETYGNESRMVSNVNYRDIMRPIGNGLPERAETIGWCGFRAGSAPSY